jgi:hypothetical protein
MAQVKLAGNGIGVDIDRPYYDADQTVIQDELPVVEFAGGFGTFEGGQAYVRAFGVAAFERAVDSVEAALVAGLGLTKDEALQILVESGHLGNLAAFNQGFFNFLKGVSDEAGLAIEDVVLALNDGVFFAEGLHEFRDHVLGELGLERRGCTVVGFDNGTLGQNNDNPVKYCGSNVLVKSVSDQVMVLTMGSPLIILMGMSPHLAVCVNTIDAFFVGHSLRDGGLPDAALILNALMSYRSVDEVTTEYRHAKMNVALSVTFADLDGGLATIEFNARQYIGNIIIQPDAADHHLAHTNHPRFTEEHLVKTWFGGDRGQADRMLANTLWRLEYADAFLRTSADRSIAEIQQLLASYPVLVPGSEGQDFRTSVSVIWSLSEQAAYIAPDRPDLTDFIRITWDQT